MSGWNQEQEYQAGIRAEQERIIKLLEAWWETDEELEELIALIRGEQL
jgi:hypothetical protein